MLTDVPEEYSTTINPKSFAYNVDNKFFTLIPDITFLYEVETKDDIERNEVTTQDKRLVMDVQTTAVLDKVWLDGVLIEDTQGYMRKINMTMVIW